MTLIMTKLSVNINKIATLRNARGGNNPDLTKACIDIINFGAHGITIHPRPDERHIKKSDVFELAKVIREYNKNTKKDKVEFNIEGYPSTDFLNLVLEIQPDQCTLVPDPPDVITSNAGWSCHKSKEPLKAATEKLQQGSVRVSLFIDPENLSQDDLLALKEIHPERCELYTEAYAKAYVKDPTTSATQYVEAAKKILELGIELNAGHDLDLQNLRYFVCEIPELKEVSIGHALICEALYDGLQSTIHSYLKELLTCP